jgi:hypothetical protein
MYNFNFIFMWMLWLFDTANSIHTKITQVGAITSFFRRQSYVCNMTFSKNIIVVRNSDGSVSETRASSVGYETGPPPGSERWDTSLATSIINA